DRISVRIAVQVVVCIAQPELLSQLSSGTSDPNANSLLQRREVVQCEVCGVNRFEHLTDGARMLEPEGALCHAVTRTRLSEREKRRAGFDGKPECTVPERKHCPVCRTSALGEDHHRYVLGESVPAFLERVCPARCLPAMHRYITSHSHHPAEYRNSEQLNLGKPLHFPWKVRNEGYIRVRLVVRDHHVGVSRLLDVHTASAEVPQRVNPGQIHAQLTERAPDAIPGRGERR